MFFIAILKGETVETISSKTLKGLSSEEKVWIDISNASNSALQEIKNEFSLHALTLEDMRGSGARVKIEEFREYTYIVSQGVLKSDDIHLGFEQLNYIVGKNFLITATKEPRTSYKNLMSDRAQLFELFEKGSGLEYIAHHLLDIEVDAFIPYFDSVEKRVDSFETDLVNMKQKESLGPIFSLKKEIVETKKVVSSMRDILRVLTSREVKFIDADSMIYFGDVYDHVIRLYDMIDGYRDLINSTLEIQLAASSYRMNDIMRILTVITTLFMPLTFLTGLYGMNFKFMPELDLKFGYPLIVVVMIIIEIGMLAYFKRTKLL